MNKIVFISFIVLIICVLSTKGQYTGTNNLGYNNLPIQLPTTNGGNFEQDIDINTNGRRSHYHRSCRNGLCYVSKAPELTTSGLIICVATFVATKLL